MVLIGERGGAGREGVAEGEERGRGGELSCSEHPCYRFKHPAICDGESCSRQGGDDTGVADP